jgi:hypothetical protein
MQPALNLRQQIMDYIWRTRGGGPVQAQELEDRARELFGGAKGSTITARLRELAPDKVKAGRPVFLVKSGKHGAMLYKCTAEQWAAYTGGGEEALRQHLKQERRAAGPRAKREGPTFIEPLEGQLVLGDFAAPAERVYQDPDTQRNRA